MKIDENTTLGELAMVIGKHGITAVSAKVSAGKTMIGLSTHEGGSFVLGEGETVATAFHSALEKLISGERRRFGGHV